MTQRRWMAAILGVVLPAIFFMSTAASAQPGKQAETMRREIEALKLGQEALQKELQEIKTLLQAREQPPAPPPPAEAIDAMVSVDGEPMRGDPSATLTLVEFSDYQCPFCRRYFQNTWPELDGDYVVTGKLRYVFRDFPLEKIHHEAFKAAEAAHCAGDEGKYWEMHDRLFSNQDDLSTDALAAQAAASGLDVDAFRACVADGANAAKVRADLAEGRKLGVTGTPTFFLGLSDGNEVKHVKRIRGAHPATVFKQEIEALLDEKKS